MDSRLISLDIETYGLCRHDWFGRSLPPQRVFNPRGSMVHDGCPRDSLILSVAITLPCDAPSAKTASSSEPPSSTSTTGTTSSLSLESLRPGETMVFEMHRVDHRRMLAAWLRWANTLLGMNLQFDLQYLRALPEFRWILHPSRHRIVDLSVVAYLHSELRPERSLKTLGPVLGTHVYPEHVVRKEHKYDYPCKEMLDYNGQDTHNTMVCIGHLARMIRRDFPGTDKLSPYCLAFYSEAIWTCIRMSEAGIPVDLQALDALESRMFRQEAVNLSILERRWGLKMEGKGSQTSKKEFLENLCVQAELASSSTTAAPSSSGSPSQSSGSGGSCGLGAVRSHPLLEYTPAEQEMSFSSKNRNLLAQFLPPDHPLRAALAVIEKVNEAQKLVGTYTYPLLRHDKKSDLKRESRLTPWPPPRASTTPPASLPTSISCGQREPSSSSRSTPTNPCPLASAGSMTPGKSDPPGDPCLHAAIPKKQAWSLRLSARCSGLGKRKLAQLSRLLSGSLQESATSKRPPLAPVLAELMASRTPTALTPGWGGGESRSSRHVAVQAVLAIPNWLVVPTHPKDGLGDEGGTKQGRIIAKAAARPQTWPPKVQKCMRSRFPEGILVKADASQIELRTAALLSGDASMVAEYQKAKPDLHGDMAVRIFGPEVLQNPYFGGGDGAKDPRQWAKQVNFLVLFRGGALKLQETILKECGVLLDFKTCKAIVDALPVQRPGLWAWQEALIKDVHKRGYIVLPWTGQSRYYMGGLDYDVNEIVNTPIQTWAGNTLLRVQAAMESDLPDMNDPDPDIWMFHNWYDAVYFDCRNQAAATRASTILGKAVQYVESQDCWGMLQDRLGRKVPLKFDVKELASATHSQP